MRIFHVQRSICALRYLIHVTYKLLADQFAIFFDDQTLSANLLLNLPLPAMSSFPPADQTSNTSFYSQSDTVNVSDIPGNVDFGSAQIRELAGLGTGKLGEIEFVQVDDVPMTAGPIASRGVLDDLCYGTGTTYLAGMCVESMK